MLCCITILHSLHSLHNRSGMRLLPTTAQVTTTTSDPFWPHTAQRVVGRKDSMAESLKVIPTGPICNREAFTIWPGTSTLPLI